MSGAIGYLIQAVNNFLTAMKSMMFHQTENSTSFYGLLLYLIFFCIFMFLFRKVVKHG